MDILTRMFYTEVLQWYLITKYYQMSLLLDSYGLITCDLTCGQFPPFHFHGNSAETKAASSATGPICSVLSETVCLQRGLIGNLH